MGRSIGGKMRLAIAILVLVVVVALGSATTLNCGVATYISYANLIQAGPDGIIIQVVLSDNNSNIVKEDGLLEILITNPDSTEPVIKRETYYGHLFNITSAHSYREGKSILEPEPHYFMDTGRQILDKIPTKDVKMELLVDFVTIEGRSLVYHKTVYWQV